MPAVSDRSRGERPDASESERYASAWPAVVDVVARRIGSREEAEAIAQEALTRALVAARREPIRQFRAFAMRIALNLATDVTRRREWRASREDPDLVPAPDEELVAGADLETLRSAVEALPPDQREVVLLKYVEGHSFAEIAERVGKSKNGVFARHERAIDALRARFARGRTP